MSNWELFLAGLKLAIFGMGWVFLFLVVMIFAVTLMEKVLRPFKDAFEPAPAAAPKAAPAPASSDDAVLAAVAAAAVELERAK